MPVSNKKLSIIVFSKDRPLQLQAYLESLIYFSNNTALNITVLYKDNPEISYNDLIKQFSDVIWVKQSIFFNDLLNIVNRSSDFIMFGCDDVIFKDHFDFEVAINVLCSKPEIWGFSLRLGENIREMPSAVNKYDSHLEWNWVETNSTNWNYPWELDCTIYRKTEITNLFAKLNPERIKNPNYLEGDIANDPAAFINQTQLASFRKGKCIVLTVNRVQDDFGNGFDSTLKTDVETLNQLYKNGTKIDFVKISKKANNKIHVGVEYFKLTGKNQPYKPFEMTFKIFYRKTLAYIKRSFA